MEGLTVKVQTSSIITQANRGSVYNRRKRKLLPFIRQIQQRLAEQFNEFENYFLIDSMLLEICKNTRSNRAKICREVIAALHSFSSSINLS